MIELFDGWHMNICFLITQSRLCKQSKWQIRFGKVNTEILSKLINLKEHEHFAGMYLTAKIYLSLQKDEQAKVIVIISLNIVEYPQNKGIHYGNITTFSSHNRNVRIYSSSELNILLQKKQTRSLVICKMVLNFKRFSLAKQAVSYLEEKYPHSAKIRLQKCEVLISQSV